MTVTFTIKLTTLTNLASARSVNHDLMACFKLKLTFMIINYDRKTFIVEATGQNLQLRWQLTLSF